MGTSYITSVSKFVSEDEVIKYFLGAIHIEENFVTGEEIRRKVVKVEKLH
jgi:hypothetical protein